jgi:hypothetical protein
MRGMKKSRAAVLAGMAGLMVLLDSPMAMAASWQGKMIDVRAGFESRSWTSHYSGSKASFQGCHSKGNGPHKDTVAISMWENVPFWPDHRIGAPAVLSECFKNDSSWSSFSRDIPEGTSVYLRVDQVNGEAKGDTVSIYSIVVSS